MSHNNIQIQAIAVLASALKHQLQVAQLALDGPDPEMALLYLTAMVDGLPERLAALSSVASV